MSTNELAFIIARQPFTVQAPARDVERVVGFILGEVGIKFVSFEANRLHYHASNNLNVAPGAPLTTSVHGPACGGTVHSV